MIGLVDRIVAIAAALDSAEVPWALGGALALAYATEEPRGTRDIDVNVFVATEHAGRVFAALPAGVSHGAADIAAALRDCSASTRRQLPYSHPTMLAAQCCLTPRSS